MACSACRRLPGAQGSSPSTPPPPSGSDSGQPWWSASAEYTGRRSMRGGGAAPAAPPASWAAGADPCEGVAAPPAAAAPSSSVSVLRSRPGCFICGARPEVQAQGGGRGARRSRRQCRAIARAVQRGLWLRLGSSKRSSGGGSPSCVSYSIASPRRPGEQWSVGGKRLQAASSPDRPCAGAAGLIPHIAGGALRQRHLRDPGAATGASGP